MTLESKGLNCQVIYNNRITRLGEIRMEQQTKDPTLARVSYHDLEDTVEPGKLLGPDLLKVKRRVVFRPASPKVQMA